MSAQSERFPRIRRFANRPDGERLVVRDVLRIVYCMPHDHQELAAGIEHALGVYRRAVGEGPAGLTQSWEDGESIRLNSEEWEIVRASLRPSPSRWFFEDVPETDLFYRQMSKTQTDRSVLLTGGDQSDDNGYLFWYQARLPSRDPSRTGASLLRATLPTEYVEAHGPGHVRELAMEMASGLPLSSGHAGLALALHTARWHALPRLKEELARYPGVDVPGVLTHWHLGDRVDGVHWLNFLGPSLLESLGGQASLRARLHSPGTTVQDVGTSGSAVVTLGAWPEAGDLSLGDNLPAYRELARVLEPCLEEFHPRHATVWSGYDSEPAYSEEEVRRWWRRFLD